MNDALLCGAWFIIRFAMGCMLFRYNSTIRLVKLTNTPSSEVHADQNCRNNRRLEQYTRNLVFHAFAVEIASLRDSSWLDRAPKKGDQAPLPINMVFRFFKLFAQLETRRCVNGEGGCVALFACIAGL